MKRSFSLIEIALSLGVAFLAVTILIAFFPTSFKRMETAQNRSYVTSSGQIFASHIKESILGVDGRPYKRVITEGVHNVGAAGYSTAPVYSQDYQDYETRWGNIVNSSAGDTADENPLPIELSTDNVDYTVFPVVATTFDGVQLDQHPTFKSLYLLRTVTQISSVANVDNLVEARVWKTPFNSTSLLSPSNWSGVYIPRVNHYEAYDKGVRVNIEVSWPASIPYAERTKKIYLFQDVFK